LKKWGLGFLAGYGICDWIRVVECMRGRIVLWWMWRKLRSWCLWTQICCSFRRCLLLHWNRVIVLLRSYSRSGFRFRILVAWYIYTYVVHLNWTTYAFLWINEWFWLFTWLVDMVQIELCRVFLPANWVFFFCCMGGFS